MKKRQLLTIFSLVAGLTVVACSNTPDNSSIAVDKSSNGLELLYFGKKVETQQEANAQKRARFFTLSADETEESEDRTITDLSYRENFKIEAQVKNEKRLSFVDIVISSGSNNQKYVFNEGNGQYQCQTTTVFRDDMWITDITIPIAFSLVDKDIDSYKCFIETYLEVEEITFLDLSGSDAKADIKADIKKLPIKCEGDPDNHVWEMKQSEDGSIDVVCSSCQKKQYGLQIDDTNKIVRYGAYPQTVVSSTRTIAALNALEKPFLNDWYYYNGSFYAKQIANPKSSASYTFDNGEAIKNGETYWFKCEPITWRIINTNDDWYYLFSSLVLDIHRYDDDSIFYKDSEIRYWLNNEFYNTAFALNESFIRITDVDNSASTLRDNNSSLACENTQDKVFLPSYQECRSMSSKNSHNESNSSSIIYTTPTDWVKSNEYASNTWWTRSPASYYVISGKDNMSVSAFSGGSTDKPIGYALGVRPAITLSIQRKAE